jgi:hypothetical protein
MLLLLLLLLLLLVGRRTSRQQFYQPFHLVDWLVVPWTEHKCRY